jgi:hypothetical protein
LSPATPLLHYDFFTEWLASAIPAEGAPIMTLIDLTIPKWRKLYEAAVLETDPKLVKPKALLAEEAVKWRLNELNGDANTHEEKAALTRTLQGLKCLKETEWVE